MRDNSRKTKNITKKSKRQKAAGIVSQAAKICRVAKLLGALLLLPSDL